MRHFAQSQSRLARLALKQRLIYSTYLLFCLIAVTSGVLLYADGPGFGTESAVRYYRGEVEAAPPPVTGGNGDGPSIELPDGNPAGGVGSAEVTIAYPRSYRQILENTHQHLFMMPVLFLVLAHLFAMSGAPRWLIGGVIVMTGVGMGGHLAAPWLVRFVGAGWAWVMPTTLWAMVLGAIIMIVGSAWDMWRPHAAP